MFSVHFKNILNELASHPSEKRGFIRLDFELLEGDERQKIFNIFLEKSENGWRHYGQLKWLLGDQYVTFMKSRLLSLAPQSHGLVFLPYFIYLETKDEKYIIRMMREVLFADAGWEQREAAIAAYIRPQIGNTSLFWDYCRYIIISVNDISMKEEAMRCLALEKGYPMPSRVLPGELKKCVAAIAQSAGRDTAAMDVLDMLHKDSGHFPPVVSFVE